MLFIVGDTYPFMAYIDLLLPHAFDSSVDSISLSNCIHLSHPPAPVFRYGKGIRHRKGGPTSKRGSGTEKGVPVLLRMYLAS